MFSGPHSHPHILAFGGERLFVDHFSLAAQLAEVDALRPQPQQQRTLSGIANHLLSVELSRGAESHVANQSLRYLLLLAPGILPMKRIQLCNLHLVLSQRAGFVGAYHRNGSHRLTGVHLPHQVLRLQHTPHAVGKAQGDGHRQALRHGNNNQADGYHHRLKQMRRQPHGIVFGREPQIADYAASHHETSHTIRHTRNKLSEPFELLAKGRFHRVVDLRSGKHLSILGIVAYP